jgi:uncharacterized membrane protein YjjB (DUF3815 family)
MRTLLKLGISLGLLAWLLRGDIGQVLAALELSPPVIATRPALIPVMVGVAAFRWWLFVPGHRIRDLVR